MKKRNKGLTTEYVLLVILVVSLLIVVILTSVSVAKANATKYQKYVERKLFMDKVALNFLQQKQQGEEDVDLSAFEHNDYDVIFVCEGNVLYAKLNGKALLTAKVDVVEGKYQFVTYFYGETTND